MSPQDPALGGAEVRPGGHDRDTRIGLFDTLLPTDLAEWAARPDCGAVVTFQGIVRDHAEGRAGVETLTYESYEQAALDRLHDVARTARERWPSIRRVALVHRTGELRVGDMAVVVAVSAPHRDAAFEAARWCIDTVKASVPIWKHERWASGAGWGTDAQPIQSSVDPVVDAAS